MTDDWIKVGAYMFDPFSIAPHWPIRNIHFQCASNRKYRRMSARRVKKAEKRIQAEMLKPMWAK